MIATSAAAVSMTWTRGLVSGEESTRVSPSAADIIPGKDARLVVHSSKAGEIETPLHLLREHRLTPKNLLFVRNNQVAPDALSLEGANNDDWTIELTGLLAPPSTIRLSELRRLPQTRHEVVVQCSGNSRSMFARSVKTQGAPWGHGAMGNVVFGGVRLSELLEQQGVVIHESARYLAAEGLDGPLDPTQPPAGSADFEHSLPLDDVLERSILAIEMNGEPLPRVHGGPVRLVTPGYYATMHVKWLSRLRFEDHETDNHHHVARYRTPRRRISPGTPFVSTLDNSDPNWRMRIKSVLWSPLEWESVAAGRVELRGVAWNDGGSKIERVEVSIDDGTSWRRAELAVAGSPFAWHPWSMQVNLPVGRTTILTRAIDATGQTQPMDGSVTWNPAGYAWNGVDVAVVNAV